jgi:hypothetical protein
MMLPVLHRSRDKNERSPDEDCHSSCTEQTAREVWWEVALALVGSVLLKTLESITPGNGSRLAKLEMTTPVVIGRRIGHSVRQVGRVCKADQSVGLTTSIR